MNKNEKKKKAYMKPQIGELIIECGGGVLQGSFEGGHNGGTPGGDLGDSGENGHTGGESGGGLGDKGWGTGWD